MAFKKVKGLTHEVTGDLDESSRGTLRRMGCKLPNWPEVILKVFKVDVTQDTESIHPLSFCHRCWMTAIRGGGVCSFSRTRVPEWKPHSSTCLICSPRKVSFQWSGKKRRKPLPRAHSVAKKIKWDYCDNTVTCERRTLRPQGDRHHAPVLRASRKPSILREQWVENITHCHKDHLSARLISEKLPVDFLFSITCLVCDHLLSDPVQSPCGHLFCRSCIMKYIQVVGPHCPGCDLTCDPTDLKTPSKTFLAVLHSLPLLCPRGGCEEQVRLDSFKAHFLGHDLEEQDTKQGTAEQHLDNLLLINKGGRPRQHLLSLTRRAQKHRLKDLKNQVKSFADKEEGGDVKSVCLTLFLLALRSGNEHRQADELEAIMQGMRLL